MALKFRPDNDLSILAISGHDDLSRLARILTHDSDGEQRRAQELLNDPAFKTAANNGDLRPAWKSIAAELQAYGGDSIANTWRSLTTPHTGVCYREILTDICGQLKLQLKPADDIKGLEDQLLVGLILKQKESFSMEQLISAMGNAAKGADMSGSLHEGINMDELIRRVATDPKISYLASITVPAIASLALPFLARMSIPAVMAAVGVRAGAALVPGLGLAAAATLLTSPAFRVTLPAALEIIRMRRLALLSPWFVGATA